MRRAPRAWTAAVPGAWLLSLAWRADAQPAPADDRGRLEGLTQPHRFEVSVGGSLLTGSDLGVQTATLTQNQLLPIPDRYPLFSTATRLQAAAGFDGRLAWHVSRTWAIEGGSQMARADIRTAISKDADGAADLTAVERVTRFAVTAALVANLWHWRIGERLLPYVEGGGGVLRTLHEDQVLQESGKVYFGGGGLRLALASRPTRRLKALALRAGVRLVVRHGGPDIDPRVTRPGVSADAGLLVVF